MDLVFDPPLLNSSNPWATTYEDLQTLYDCPYTGAVSVRTSLLEGYKHDDSIHQYVFFDAHSAIPNSSSADSSLNTLGYSPISLDAYLAIISTIVTSRPSKKPFIISVTGDPPSICKAHVMIASTAANLCHPLLMEINLSCPNIANAPPPAYSSKRLAAYLSVLDPENTARVPVGIKTPPYTYADQFTDLITALRAVTPNESPVCPVSFITATNTLGSCLVVSSSAGVAAGAPVLNSATGNGIGGMAGAALHPLALGNVRTIRTMLDAESSIALNAVKIIGVGGVGDAAGYSRMRAVGAWAVGVGTGFGKEGIDIFRRILKA